MSRKREHEAEKENGERWLLTYSDLITLLMIFFVVLYSMSKVDAEKFQAVAESLNKALGGGTPAKIELASNPVGPSLFQAGTPSAKTTAPGKGTDPNNTTYTDPATNGENKNAGQGNFDAEKMSIDAIKAKLDKFAADNGIQATLVTSIEERGLVVSIQETLLFDSGSAVITPHARAILEKVSTVLAAAPNQIKVEGHTDNLPIHTAQFPSNWELSVIRATNVVQILQSDGINPNQLSATGYGEYRPISSNNTDAGRSRNRRIDLIILRSKYDVTEPINQTPVSDLQTPAPKIKP
ncbi:flagellar motor protein MotB [Desulfosporosinus sp. BG]|uniref:flagellar motor protein MotB n=1 Tax=Desulfosporosinus sp. BG TaxID=1633135 RepID=UPI000839E8B9|nr:flagellar motor protein MotB [Desulfosporosinus sp. BG]ODA42542.1 Flagellar motor rotation protein MotB [Desulfosporosinus sp. BG]